jgi:hypothetical protein
MYMKTGAPEVFALNREAYTAFASWRAAALDGEK